jgi:hypothetical protein
LNTQDKAAPVLQEAKLKLPESVPFVHALCSCTQVWPKGTVELWYAVIEFPLVIVLPLKRQAAGPPTWQNAYG